METVLRILSLLSLLVVSPTLAQSPSGDAASGAPTFTVMTWNLEWFYDEYQGDNFSKLAREKSAPSRAEWDWRRDAVARSLAKANPSLVALQEVENRRVTWYLCRALSRNHQLEYDELGIESRDHFTEQDVALLHRPPVDVLSMTQRGYPKRLRSTNDYYDVTKHLIAEFELPAGDQIETVLVVNLHLRARAEAESIRVRQARLVHRWIAEAVTAGRNVLVLGDFNTEEMLPENRPDRDVGIISGLHTSETSDDLVDITLHLVRNNQPTHVLGRVYDRILCSRSMIEDDPNRADLVFSNVELRKDLAIQSGPDDRQQHWDNYWDLPQSERDLSDHYPVMATFEIK